MRSLIYSILLLSIFILFSKSENADKNDQISKDNGLLTWKIIIVSLFVIIFFALTVIIIGISLLCKWYCKWPKFTRSSNEESINACNNSPPNSSSQNEPTRLDILESNVQFLTKSVEKRQRQNSLLSKNSTIDELADETNSMHPHFHHKADQKFNPHTNFFDAYGSFKRSKEKVEMPRLSISENNEDLAFV
jgi:hypothetical protein